MRVAVVGAGMAGLGASRTLREAGVPSVLFEKSRAPGGRVHSWSRDGFTWDTGATGVAPGGSALEEAMAGTGVERVTLPVWIHRDLRPEPGDPAREKPKWVHPQGFLALARALAEGLDVRYGVEVEAIAREEAGYVVAGEAFDAVVLTPPVPQTARLLWTLGESRAIAGARYRACLTLLLGYDAPTPETPYHALLSGEKEHPLGWIALESRKVGGRAPEGGSAFTLQLGARFSQEGYGLSDEALIEAAGPWMRGLYGPAFARPLVSRVKRWKYSQPDASARFEDANPAGARLLVAGDGVSAGRAERAYDSGVEAARRLL